MIGDSFSFTPMVTSPYYIEVIAIDEYISLTQAYTLEVQTPVSFTASVSPSSPVINYESNFIAVHN